MTRLTHCICEAVKLPGSTLHDGAAKDGYVNCYDQHQCAGHDQRNHQTGEQNMTDNSQDQTQGPKIPQNDYPTVRLTSRDGKLKIYPRMVPDGKGGMKISRPDVLKKLLGTD